MCEMDSSEIRLKDFHFPFLAIVVLHHIFHPDPLLQLTDSNPIWDWEIPLRYRTTHGNTKLKLDLTRVQSRVRFQDFFGEFLLSFEGSIVGRNGYNKVDGQDKVDNGSGDFQRFDMFGRVCQSSDKDDQSPTDVHDVHHDPW